ncbi:MAG: alpha/beta fold hydrolase [Acidobacteriota bacterium]
MGSVRLGIPTLILVIGIAVTWFAMHRWAALAASGYSAWRKTAERVVLSIVIVLTVVVTGSSLYNVVALLYFRSHNLPPGKIYVVGGYRMHLDCTGSGSPTLVLDAGLGNDSLVWGGVQPVLSKTTRVCSYDRAGFGWSAARPGPRDADHIASELHELLMQAQVTGPIVLMGHSIAGLYIRDYASRYPADVVGMVFVDSSMPLQNRTPIIGMQIPTGRQGRERTLLIEALYGAGIPRLLGQCSRAFKGFAPHASMLLDEDICDIRVNAIDAELSSIDQSGMETVHTGPYGEMPILIFSHDSDRTLPKAKPRTWMVERESAWNGMQERLKRLSKRSRRIIALDSSHYIQLDRPGLIEREVSLFIEQIRDTAPQPTNNKLTVAE